MISVIIPTLNSEQGLAATLTSLVPAAVEGLVREVIVADGGSSDRTLAIADDAGAEIVKADAARASQLRAGAGAARFPWLLFINADIELETGWEREARQLMERVDSGRRPATAAVFRYSIDDEGLAPRMCEALAAFSAAMLKLPNGGHGLLVAKRLYDEIGGYRDLASMEDVDIARRLTRRRITTLRARAIANAERFRREGYLEPMVRGHLRLGLYLLRLPMATRILPT